MLSLGNSKIYLCREAADLRKGFDGLSVLVPTLFGEEVTNGAYFVFMNKQRNKMKILFWDYDGLVIWSKRLEKGSFCKNTNERSLMERREFLMLLEGVTPKRLNKRYKHA